ncbi:c-type cytochrome [Runella aurantiaca]|uniref:Diheme cytochrome c-553 n=1 Tax=Runella aurantiaca TaxID=2282308 RepID=A0A369I8A1_9BACT|nr:c-type cytochrome [Runella aurantiaca]RDB05991.1 diheme cytochrome c-553 [Runella aurantiaca]
MKKQISILALVVFSVVVLFSFTRPQALRGLSRGGLQSLKSKTAYTQAQIEKGKYLVEMMGCAHCHAPKKMTPQGPIPDPDLGLSGHPAKIPMGKVVKTQDWVLFHPMTTIAVGPWGASFSANLTPEATGIGSWSEEQFLIAITEGKSKGIRTARPLLPPMPWRDYVHAKKEDLVAIFAYLKSCKPIENIVPQPISPDKL